MSPPSRSPIPRRAWSWWSACWPRPSAKPPTRSPSANWSPGRVVRPACRTGCSRRAPRGHAAPRRRPDARLRGRRPRRRADGEPRAGRGRAARAHHRRRFPRSWLRAGAAASAVLLTATSLGLATCPLSQNTEVEAVRTHLRSGRVAALGAPQLVVRVGYAPAAAPPLPRTPAARSARCASRSPAAAERSARRPRRGRARARRRRGARSCR
ncbi:nitroreductase family protein [Actinokineospora soli]|uniref:Nitroreductase family protein n=1 Tax=Actinokineospora soli TaxID=1048753 RepID=A0ABW2TQE7_9PSEU